MAIIGTFGGGGDDPSTRMGQGKIPAHPRLPGIFDIRSIAKYGHVLL